MTFEGKQHVGPQAIVAHLQSLGNTMSMESGSSFPFYSFLCQEVTDKQTKGEPRETQALKTRE